MRATYRFFIITILVLSIFTPAFTLPATGGAAPAVFSNPGQPLQTSPTAGDVPSFKAFVDSVTDGSNQVTGVYVEGLFAYRVLQTGNAVPSGGGVVGQYGRAKNIGLLAHNYAAGAMFHTLTPGMKIKIIYGTGKVRTFTVKKVDRYQASNSNDFSAPFTNTQTGKQMSAQSLFKKMYSSGVTFQTCITQDGSTTWGLLFVRAK